MIPDHRLIMCRNPEAFECACTALEEAKKLNAIFFARGKSHILTKRRACERSVATGRRRT
jgi:hypothetical protein